MHTAENGRHLKTLRLPPWLETTFEYHFLSPLIDFEG